MQTGKLPHRDLHKKNSNTVIPSFLVPHQNPPKYFIETEMKTLRETGSTLCPTPKNKNKIHISDFLLLKLLGKGRFGSVYLAAHKQTGYILAIKVIQKRVLKDSTEQQSAKLMNQLVREIKIQMFLEHPNLISLYSFFDDERSVYLLMEVGCGGQLYELMKKKRSFSEEAISFLIRQILQGLDYMHSHNVIHRDLKPQNIVLQHGVPKICDFGWSVFCSNEFRSTLCGTPLYLSPEILQGDGYNEKIDTWAIGTLTFELQNGDNPFSITKKSEMIRIVTEKPMLSKGTAIIKDFIDGCLSKNPKDRPESSKLLKHSFIDKYKQLETCEQICCNLKHIGGIEKIKISRHKF